MRLGILMKIERYSSLSEILRMSTIFKWPLTLRFYPSSDKTSISGDWVARIKLTLEDKRRIELETGKKFPYKANSIFAKGETLDLACANLLEKMDGLYNDNL